MLPVGRVSLLLLDTVRRHVEQVDAIVPRELWSFLIKKEFHHIVAD